MADAISNTSPLVYLYRIGGLEWLRHLFAEIWVPQAVIEELEEGIRRGYDVPEPDRHHWLRVVNPTLIPSEWLALDFGPGELAAMALALEYRMRTVLLDDLAARRTAQAAGLEVWGTLKVLLEAKAAGLIPLIEPSVDRLVTSGMWMSDDIRRRILRLAEE
jgi:predicted nucleic acid-binding protein